MLIYFAGVGICALAHLVQPNFQIVLYVGDALNKLFGHIDISTCSSMDKD